MRKKLFLLLVGVLTAVCGVAQTSGTCGDNLTWSFDSETGTLTISGTGAMADWWSIPRPWDGISSQIKQVIIGYGVTRIGASAFNNGTCDAYSSLNPFCSPSSHKSL